MTEMEDRVETAIYEACDYALPPHLLRKATRAAIEAMPSLADALKGFSEIANLTDLEMKDGDAAREVAEQWLALHGGQVNAALGKVDA